MAIGYFFINLDRDEERRSHMMTAAAQMGLDFVRISAVDLTLLAATPSASFRPFRYSNERWTLRPFETAVFESHRKAWSVFLESEHEVAVIMEDDMLFARSFAETVNILQTCPETFDIVKLNHSAQPRRMGRARQLAPGLALRPIHENMADAGCYMLTRPAAMQLLASSRTYCAHVDDFIFSPDRGMRIFQLIPPNSAQILYMENRARQIDTVSTRLLQSDRADKGPPAFRIWKELRRLAKNAARRLRSRLQQGEQIDMPALLSEFRPMDQD